MLLQPTISISAREILVLQKQISATIAIFKKLDILKQERDISNQGNFSWRIIFLSLLSSYINGLIIRQGVELHNELFKTEMIRKCNKVLVSKKVRNSNSSNCICYL